MDLQKFLDVSVQAQRAQEMLTSPQLTLGELILKLEAIKDKTKPIVLDDGTYLPTGFGSWRGSYRELAIRYQDGGESFYNPPQPSCKRDSFGDHAYDCPCDKKDGFSTSLPQNPTVSQFLEMARSIVGNIMVGYKGGDYLMGKTTPVWVANYGTSSGYNLDDEAGKYNQGIVDIKEESDRVSIITEVLD